MENESRTHKTKENKWEKQVENTPNINKSYEYAMGLLPQGNSI
jgi:hypothetical protein